MPTNKSSKNKNDNAFAKHKAAAQNNNDAAPSSGARMPLTARLLIFIFIPSFTGLCGLGISYLQSMNAAKYYGADNKDDDDGGGEEAHEVNFDRDFVTPFLLSMAFVIVLGFQTNGFAPSNNGNGNSGNSNRKGAFAWPKTRKVQKIRHERVIVDDDEDDNKKEQ